MKLKKVRVTKYKCVNDSNEFEVEDKATCLVGKNESGKTTLLHALSKLNAYDINMSQYSDLEFPRTLMTEFEGYADGHPLWTSWVLEANDVAALAKVIGPSANTIGIVEIRKDYRNQVVVKFDHELDEIQVINFLLSESKLSPDELTPLKTATDVSDLFRIVSTRPDPVKSAFAAAHKLFENKTITKVATEIVVGRLPKFAYFSEYLRMPGQLSLTALSQHMQSPGSLTGGEKVFLALLEMIGSKLDDLQKTTQFERLQARLEAASNRLTSEIFAYWTQNRHLKVQFRFEQGLQGDPSPFNSGFVLRTRIENTRHGVTTSFDDRSAGFVWFFSFLIWFSQVKKTYGDNIVLLLDEPGLTLHASAQQDLLRFFREKLTPYFQVIYTTHSPFLIEAANILATRTVEDVFIEPKAGESLPNENLLGTKVRSDVLTTEKETLFPLQACLGYDITQTLFIGKNSLLVEGPSDVLYLHWFSARLREAGRTGLDLRWTVVPCGGLDKVGSFVALFGGSQLNLAVVCDYAHGSKKSVKSLKESELLASGSVFSAETYAAKPEADLEDVIGSTNFISIVNACYASHLETPLPVPGNDASRIIPVVEDHFRLLAPPTPEFDHYSPAEFLFRSERTYSLPDMASALDRFEKLFKDINALVKTA